ncbi:Processive diacylglycerol alpha-glucosyltransferase [Acaryochloris thomasi RCC1774]|uniref:Processive diacylglycerol alpha-glucosyltransferase n=1 Tax=Acaryochloris thomasi RCC1774 TaxID=1764569 RepID=A0A2W1JUL2_9CYAN|nr:glycosyltransferase [Acaryochloris thomasi]PZD74172.1 Processive diacylglycerol alpha-glucosyltransferase [Acaryochloris thomasi RCC1774]
MAKKIKSILYVSLGNLPSKLASSIQVAKMSQAIGQKVKDFALVTSGDILSAIRGMEAGFQSWYAIRHRFKLIRIPVHFQAKYPFPKNYAKERYFKWAVLYACLRSPTLVYTRSYPIVSLLLETDIPILWEQHELLPEKLPEDSLYHRLFASDSLVGLVTLSPLIAKNYIKNGLSTEKVLIAHSGVDISIFQPYRSKSEARKHLSLTGDRKIILYGGHLYEHKGMGTLVETALRMPECRFILVGGWQADIERVKAACRQKNVRNVIVVGHVSQSVLAMYLYAADVLLLPTSKQWQLAQTTSPMKLFEYMAVQRPIVASALPNIMTVLRDRENALLAEPDQPQSFQQAITELLEKPALADEIAKQAFREVDQYTWDSRAEIILRFAEERLEKMNFQPKARRNILFKYLKTITFT